MDSSLHGSHLKFCMSFKDPPSPHQFHLPDAIMLTKAYLMKFTNYETSIVLTLTNGHEIWPVQIPNYLK
jgi:hypothetical protein